ncbi:MAG TPA: thiamine pyrophosphate-dependent enzyme [Candidatus Eisenbacteria bacterium]|nr:thiamine pyrophosphate-dependent enzyme [Candidatus Eisenbacteria bacterium]
MSRAKVTRKEILRRLSTFLDDKDIVVAALAGTSNECFHTMHRPMNLYMVGMGMVTSVAFGLARALPHRRTIALDTDGGQLLSPSILPVVGTYKPKNLCMIVFDNERLYGSRGGPPSQTASGTDLSVLAKGAGLATCATVETVEAFSAEFERFVSGSGPAEIVCKVEPAYERGTGPNFSGQENKFRFVRLIEESEGVKILEGAI